MVSFQPFFVALLSVVINLNGVLAYYNFVNTSSLPCNNLLQRREWYVSHPLSFNLDINLSAINRRTLNDTEKTDYINAVKCLQSRPAFEPRSISAIQSRFDDFQALHIQVADRVHLTVSILTSQS